MNTRLKIMDSMHATVFSSDMLHIPEELSEFKRMLARWQKAVSEHESPPDSITKLATFGAMVLDAHRNPEPADVDGGTLQELATQSGVIVERQVTEPCGEDCTCANVGAIPSGCYFVPDEIGNLAKTLRQQHQNGA